MILIMGIGNPLRQDDGAGRALADRLAEALKVLDCPCRVVYVQQLAPENAMLVASPDISTVCFADVAVDLPGLQLSALGGAEAPEDGARITHQVGPNTLLAYVSVLRPSAPHAWLFTLGGAEFGHGEGLSEIVRSDSGRCRGSSRSGSPHLRHRRRIQAR